MDTVLSVLGGVVLVVAGLTVLGVSVLLFYFSREPKGWPAVRRYQCGCPVAYDESEVQGYHPWCRLHLVGEGPRAAAGGKR